MHYPHVVVLKPSPMCMIAIATLHLGVAIAFAYSISGGWLLAAASMLLLGSAFHAVCTELAKRDMRLWLENDGLVTVEKREGVHETALLSAVDFGWGVWLVWPDSRCGGLRVPSVARGLMLLPDNVHSGSWRLLRIWLRHKALMQSDPADGGFGG